MDILRHSFLCVLLIATAARTIDSSRIQNQYKSHNGMIGVASIAGIASRNGRVSTINGVKFYPEGAKTVRMSNMYHPLTVSAEKDGRFASGSVQVYPGYVSTSAQAGYAPPGTRSQDLFKNYFQPPNIEVQKPFKGYMFQPPELFSPPNIESLFSNDFFKGVPSPPSDLLRNGWLIPGFNPFVNFWR